MSIPISQIVQINPGVVGTGSNPLSLNGLVLTTNAVAPVGSVKTCYNLDDVTEFFGASSKEADFARIYFGNTNVRQALLPNALYFTRYGIASTGAWARGASIAGTTLEQLQEVTGTLSVTVDGVEHTADSLSLSSAASFTAAAQAIQTALDFSNGETVTWDAEASRFEIYSGTTGSSSTISAITGTAADDLGLDNATLSQGSDAVTETDAVNAAAAVNLNWATFTAINDSDSISASTNQALAQWQAGKNHRYLFVAWDSDVNAKDPDATGTFGQWVQENGYNVPVCYDNPLVAALVMNIAASINWNAVNGRSAFAFKSMEGLQATVDNLTDANALLENGYSYYGAYTADGLSNNYNIFYDGKLAGEYGWLDTYVNQIFLNAQLRLAMFDLLRGVNTLPYDDFGKTQIRSAAQDPINQGLLNGSIRAGIELSESQKIQIQSMVGFDISNELYTKGYYLFVGDATAQARGMRASPPIYFFYCDGGSVQRITIPSIVIQ